MLRHKRTYLSCIVQCLLSNTVKDRIQDNAKDKRQKDLNISKIERCLVDAFNPWHSILVNKIFTTPYHKPLVYILELQRFFHEYVWPVNPLIVNHCIR